MEKKETFLLLILTIIVLIFQIYANKRFDKEEQEKDFRFSYCYTTEQQKAISSFGFVIDWYILSSYCECQKDINNNCGEQKNTLTKYLEYKKCDTYYVPLEYYQLREKDILNDGEKITLAKLQRCNDLIYLK